MLAYGIGITVSPMFIAIFMTLMGAKGLLVYFISVIAFLIVFTLYFISTRPAVLKDMHNAFTVLPQNTTETIELDPRVQDEGSGYHQKS